MFQLHTQPTLSQRIELGVQQKTFVNSNFWYGWISQVAHKLGLLYSEMIFVNGYVHCDPHPGNILVRRNPQNGVEIVFLDHGLYQVCILRYNICYIIDPLGK